MRAILPLIVAGLAVLVCLGCIFTNAPRIEGEISQQTTAAINDLGLSGDVTLQRAAQRPLGIATALGADGRDITLVGEVRSDADKARAEQAARAVDGVRVVHNNITVKKVGPADLTLNVRGSGKGKGKAVVLSGMVPDETSKASLLKRAQQLWGNKKVTDEMTVLGIDPHPGFQTGAMGLLPWVFTLGDAIGTADARQLALRGVSQYRGQQRAATLELQGETPDGHGVNVDLGKINWTAADGKLVAVKDKHGHITLRGVVPDEGARNRANEQAKTRFPKAKIIDQMVVGGFTPDANFGKGWEAWLDYLNRTTRGKVEQAGNQMYFQGYGDRLTSLEPELGTALAGMGLTPEIFLGKDLKGAECVSALQTLLGQEKIQFDVGRSFVKQSSAPLLNRIAATLDQCPDSKLRIAGHTDSDGNDVSNQRLSDRRAAEVKRQLILRDVSSRRLSTIGFGESKPIADNATDAGKAQNRRIEFDLLKGAN